ncbi:FtsK/SpoIIIE domain-containing protein [Nonomuraea sp. NPDC055795]
MSVAHREAAIRGLVAAFRAYAPVARKVAAEAQLGAERDRQQAVRRAERTAEAERHRIQAAVRRAMDGARETAAATTAELAPGVAGLPFSGAEWGSLGTAAPSHVRVGVCGEVPVVVPLLPTAGWYAAGDGAAGLILGAVLRAVAAAPAGRVQVDSYDPRLTGALGVFGEALPRSLSGVAELAERVGDLVRTVHTRAQRIAQSGGCAFEELAEPYRLMVVLDYPAGVDESVQRDLLRVAESAAGRGVCFLVQHNAAIQPERGVEPERLAALLRRVEAGRERIAVAGLENVACRPDPPPGPELFAAVAGAAAGAQLPRVPFAGTLPPRRDWWARVEKGDGLRIAVGAEGREPAWVRLSSSNPPLPNILIGGSAGQGKSNLLLVLIHGLAARYSPADLEMYLLDFKQGLEFERLGGERWLPHARVLGVFSDREFGLAVLRHVHEQMELRSETFKRLRVTDIAGMDPGPDRPPRLLLVLDEFQVMLAEDDPIADEATALLEKLVRLGRAYGVHVVLATQTIEGIQRLATKREAIFGQVPNRIVLKTTAADSQSLLSSHNTAAAGLRFRGQAVLNDDYGSPEANRVALIAHAREEELAALRAELWHHARAERRPRVFKQDEPADLAALLHHPVESGPDLVRPWVGVPVAVTERPAAFDVRQEPGAGLLILGDDAAAARGVLAGLSASIGKARPADRFVWLDGLEEARAIPGQLAELREEMRERDGGEPWVHVLGFGMHRARMRMGDDFTSPADTLKEIVKDGPDVGVFFYGWWNRMNVCTEHLGFDRCHVSSYLFLRHPVEAVQQVCGPLVAWSARPGRGLLHDGLSGEPLPVVIFG